MTMDAARWERVQTLFHEAAELPHEDRLAFLHARCDGDETIVEDVRKLLEEDAAHGSILDRGLAQVAHEMLEPDRVERAMPDLGRSEPISRTLGPYRLIRPIGEGGSGVVYLAEQTSVGRPVAIKILRDAWLSPARRERFIAEQRLLAALTHPSIARLYDADTLPDGTPWFAMELVDGQPLTEACDASGASIRRRIELFRRVCETVLFAHRHAVVHRDLKPSNILLARTGEVKLLDFGIAKRLDETGTSTGHTVTHARHMTPAYAAPEQVRGGSTGVHTDVYALGAVLYELLTGKPPFDLSNRSSAEIDRLITEADPERPSAVVRKSAPSRARGGSWPDLDALCLTAMHKDPAKRYRSVDSFIRDLDHYLRGEPLEAQPFSPRVRAGKFVRRHWKALAVTSGVAAALIGLVAFYTVHLREARNAALAEAERTRRIQAFMTQLFEGDEAAGPADTLRVVTLLTRGVEQAEALVNEPSIHAELLQTLGSLYQGLGEIERADTLLQRSLDTRRAHLGEDHLEVARSLVALGLLRADQSRLEEAEDLVRQGLVITQRDRHAEPAALADATMSLGLIQEARGTYEDAISTLTRAVQLNEGEGRATQRSMSLTALANCHFYTGRYAEADSLNRVILAMDSALYGENHPNVASDLANLGAIQQEWGHNEEAERYYRRSLGIYRSYYGEDHHETASLMTMVARVLVSEGRREEAGELLRESLAIRERVFGPEHSSVASTLNEIGRLAQQEGRTGQAKEAFERAIKIYIQVYDDRHYAIGVAIGNLAGVYMDTGELEEAERLFREAVRRYGETLPPDHQYQGVMRVKLGRALLRQKRYEEATRETLAGYSIIRNQTEPAEQWIEAACTDLVEAYEALGDSEQAVRYRAELPRAETTKPEG